MNKVLVIGAGGVSSVAIHKMAQLSSDFKEITLASKTIQNCLIKSYYNTNVFLTPFWKEIYHNDNERLEDIKKAINIEFHLINTYEKYGFNIVKIPKLSIRLRADFILQNIRQ